MVPIILFLQSETEKNVESFYLAKKYFAKFLRIGKKRKITFETVGDQKRRRREDGGKEKTGEKKVFGTSEKTESGKTKSDMTDSGNTKS